MKEKKEDIIDGPRPELWFVGQWVNRERRRAFEEFWEQESGFIGNNRSTLLYSRFLD